jgi:hypothetical protein
LFSPHCAALHLIASLTQSLPSPLYRTSAMTPLAPVSRAVPQERTPLNLLPPSQPRAVVTPDEPVSKEIAVVDSNKSYASLFGSKPAQTEHESHEDRGQGPENQHQSNQSQSQFNQNQNQNQNQDSRNFDQDRSDRSYDQNHMNQNQNQNQNHNNQGQNQNQNDRNFPSFNNLRNENPRDRDDRADGHWDNKNNGGGGDDHPQNAVARKKQLFDPRSNKMVDPEMHPENLPPSENKQRSQQLQGQGQKGDKGDKDKGDLPHESLKRPRPQQSRFDDTHNQNTWIRGMANTKTKEDNKNIMIPPSDLAADNNDNAHEVSYLHLFLSL